MRSMGKKTITFGMVSIPVKIYASQDRTEKISFNQINGKTGNRVKQQLIDAVTGEVVDRKNLLKGYEFAKGQYVTFTQEEVKSLADDSSEEIDIHEFVPLGAVDPVLYDKPYYLAPDKGGDRAYALLTRALKETGMCAVGQYTSYGSERLILLRVGVMDELVMQVLKYPEEVRGFDQVPVKPTTEVHEGELNLAKQIIQSGMKKTFDGEKFTDKKLVRMKEAIQKKIDGSEVIIPVGEAPKARVIDLMEALKASLAIQ